MILNHLHTPIQERNDTIHYRCPVCTLPSPCALHEMCQVEGCYLAKPCTIHEPETVIEMQRLAQSRAADAAEEGPRRSRRGSIDPSAADGMKKGTWLALHSIPCVGYVLCLMLSFVDPFFVPECKILA